MPIRICKASELTPHGRGRKPSAIEDLAEFVDVKTKLSYGLKPFEAIEVELPESPIKTLRELFKRKVSHYLKSLTLTDYEVMAYRAHGKDYVSVVNTMPISSALRVQKRFTPQASQVA
jgi:hypothetical protein